MLASCPKNLERVAHSSKKSMLAGALHTFEEGPTSTDAAQETRGASGSVSEVYETCEVIVYIASTR